MILDLDEAELSYISRALFRQRIEAPEDEPELASRLDPKISVARYREQKQDGDVPAQTEPAHLLVLCKPWEGDHPPLPGEEQTSMLDSRVFVNGQELLYATGIDVSGRGGEFVEASLHIVPASIKFEFERQPVEAEA